MTDTTTPNTTLRNSKQGQQAMPMPAGSGAMLTCKVPVKRPMPCTVIVIHGVNDDGQFFPIVDRHICDGLNKRLGRDDLFPHKWEKWIPEGKVPSLDNAGTSVSSSDCLTRIAEEGRSPVIPFHWGYHPVDFQEYHRDQLRYKEQLDARNSNPDLPYSTYYLDNQAKYANKDSLGNWLDGSQAKEGGPFANATTNLVDMWGPSANGGTYDAIAWAKRQFTDTSSPMYPNPHRIYYVHAAQRLADLIIKIRGDKNAGPDTVNIVAHSQGTEITMLANFLVKEAGERPVDCVILCNSPYALDPASAELVLPGKHQSRDARVHTLANFTQLMYEKRKSVSAAQVVSKGVANKQAWDNPDHSRDNFGHVYNYFCPQDGVVSLPNIQGIGWQGVDTAGKKAIAAKAPSFFQRVFSDGHVIGTGPETFRFGSQGESQIAGSFMSRDRSRTIDGPKLPESYTFRTLSNDPEHADHVGEHLAGTTLAQEGPQKLLRLVDTRTGAESVSSIAYPSGVQASAQQVQAQLTAAGYKNQVLKAWFMGVPTSKQTQYLVQRYETPDEAVARLGKRAATWSQHSAITLHADTIAKCMAYDLAIGLCVGHEGEPRSIRDAYFAPAGFATDERLWPKPDNAFGGYQLLLEYFSFPEKFLFVDLYGIDLAALAPSVTEFEVEVVLNQTYPADLRFTEKNIRLFCTPIINLFRMDAEPVRVDHRATSYVVRPRLRHGEHVETYSVDAVDAHDHVSGERVEYVPFSSFKHRGGMLRHEAPERYYHTRVQQGVKGLYETCLVLGGHAWESAEALPRETLSLRVTGTNGLLPRKSLREAGINEMAQGIANVARVRNLVSPTLPLHPPSGDRSQWRLLSHLAPNYLSLLDAEMLRGTLALYDWTDGEMNRRRLDGIQAVTRKGVRKVMKGAVERGEQIEVTLDSHAFAGEGDMMLFGEMLHRFFELYADVNLFTQLVIVSQPTQQRIEWPVSKSDRAPL